MDTPHSDPTDVLAQTTRARLFDLLGQLKHPVGTAELSERLSLHPNGVRVHLERMAEARLVTRTRISQARGRPRDAWTIAPDARPGGRPPEGYRDLGRWLARVVGSRERGVRGIEQTGRKIGRELAPSDAPGDAGALETTLAALGFQPATSRREHDRMTIRLGNCPYRDAVKENQPAICALHKGITRGLLDVLHPRAQLAAFVPKDPDRAGCLIELRRMPAGPAG